MFIFPPGGRTVHLVNNSLSGARVNRGPSLRGASKTSMESGENEGKKFIPQIPKEPQEEKHSVRAVLEFPNWT